VCNECSCRLDKLLIWIIDSVLVTYLEGEKKSRTFFFFFCTVA